MPNGKHDIYVFSDDNGYKVRPAVAMAARANKISVRNCTDKRVFVDFQGAPVVPESGTPLIGADSSKKFKLLEGANCVYPFQVLVTVAPGFTVAAVGQSGPKLIVDP